MNHTQLTTAAADHSLRPRLPPWLLLPALAWLLAFFFLPLLMTLAVSFATRGPYGGVAWTWTLANYATVLDPLYVKVFARSLLFAAATTAVCLILGFPLAYSMARAPARWQPVWLLLVVLPFWSNFLVRTYAWIFILRTEGLMNTLLMEAGLISRPIELLYTDWAVLIGLGYGYLPFMVLPLYAAIERVDRSLVEAAWDLYATPWAVFRRIVWPLARPGVIAGCVLVFIPSLGAYITPDLLGGGRTLVVGTLIQHEYLIVRDWPVGSAVSFVLMGLVMVGLLLFVRMENVWRRER